MSAAAHVARVVQRCEDAKDTQQLDLSWCMLESFPDAVFFLLRNSTLVGCNLCNNHLKRFSRKFCSKFKDLSDVNSSQNELKDIPGNINELEQLKVLDMSMNKITTLPPSFFSLLKLEILDLGDNDITDLDVDRLCGMPSLKKVTLSGNPLSGEVIQQLQTSAKFELILSDTGRDVSDVD